MISRNILRISILACLFSAASVANAQFEFTLPTGEIIRGGSDTTFSAENPFSTTESKFIFVPMDGLEIAHLTMISKGEETQFYAKKIVYSEAGKDLLMEGNARITKGESYMIGPDKIQFSSDKSSDKSIMVVYGNSKQKAVVNYIAEDKTKINSISDSAPIYLRDEKRETGTQNLPAYV